MTWFKVDDSFYAQSATVSLAATGLYVRAGSWCAKHNTRGHVPRVAIDMALTPGVTKTKADSYARELVRAGMWRTQPDGFKFVRWVKSRPSIPARVRAAVLKRDGYLCGICGDSVDQSDVHLDHVLPYSLGGPATVENLRVTHSLCNVRRGASWPASA